MGLSQIRVWGLSWGDLLAPRNFQGMEGGWALLPVLLQETPGEKQGSIKFCLAKDFPDFSRRLPMDGRGCGCFPCTHITCRAPVCRSAISRSAITGRAHAVNAASITEAGWKEPRDLSKPGELQRSCTGAGDQLGMPEELCCERGSAQRQLLRQTSDNHRA